MPADDDHIPQDFVAQVHEIEHIQVDIHDHAIDNVQAALALEPTNFLENTYSPIEHHDDFRDLHEYDNPDPSLTQSDQGHWDDLPSPPPDQFDPSLHTTDNGYHDYDISDNPLTLFEAHEDTTVHLLSPVEDLLQHEDDPPTNASEAHIDQPSDPPTNSNDDAQHHEQYDPMDVFENTPHHDDPSGNYSEHHLDPQVDHQPMSDSEETFHDPMTILGLSAHDHEDQATHNPDSYDHLATNIIDNSEQEAETPYSHISLDQQTDLAIDSTANSETPAQRDNGDNASRANPDIPHESQPKDYDPSIVVSTLVYEHADERFFGVQSIGEAVRKINALEVESGDGLRVPLPMPVDIDEPRAVINWGNWDDAANKRFLDFLTNQATKRDLEEQPPIPNLPEISLREAKNKGDAMFREAALAMLDRRFSEVHELKAIAEAARQDMRNLNRPRDELRVAVNKAIRNRIKKSSNENAVLVREALKIVGIDLNASRGQFKRFSDYR